jgi:hypothetical protein
LQNFCYSVTLAEYLWHYFDDENRSFPVERKKQAGHPERKKETVVELYRVNFILLKPEAHIPEIS